MIKIKKLALCVLALALMGIPLSSAYEEMPDKQDNPEKQQPVKRITKGFDQLIAPQCPETLITLDSDTYSYNVCTNCHVEPTWQIKEHPPDITRDYPFHTTVAKNTLIFKLYENIDSSSMRRLEDAIRYAEWHEEIDTIEVDILSGGGSLFVAWQMITRLEAIKEKYRVVTMAPGFAASAAFLLWQAGDERICYAHSILMHHELWTFELFKMEDVSDAEEAARVKRLLQDNIHQYLVKRSILTLEQLDEYVKGERDYWLNGQQALELGFATKLIGQ